MSEGQTALPPERRSILGPLVSCLALVSLLAAAIAGGAFLVRGDPAPQLSESNGEWILTRAGRAPVRVLLGPGCSDLRLVETEVGDYSLAWVSEGQPLSVGANWAGEAVFVGSELLEPGQAALLLPNQECHSVDPATKPLLQLERWEGGLGETGRCVIWLYRGNSTPFLSYLLDDGHQLGTTQSSGHNLGSTGRSFHETYANDSRQATFPEGEDRATYVLTLGGKTQEAILEQTYEGDWSPGDPLPQAAGY